MDIPQKKQTRDRFKCSECRSRKIKCTPPSRDWFTKQQKCDNCETHNLLCGPNIKKDGQDPSTVRRRRADPEFQRVPSPAAEPRHTRSSNNPASSPLSEGKEDIRRRPVESPTSGKERKKTAEELSDEELKEEALSRINDLNVSVDILRSTASLLTPPCGHPRPQHDEIPSIEKKSHHSFLKAYRLAVEAEKRAQDDRVSSILLQLVCALDKHPVLYDLSKLEVLLEMALMFQRLRLPWQSERILWKVCEMQIPAPSTPEKDPCYLLVDSVAKTSGMIRQFFTKIWNGRSISAAPPHMDISGLHRVAQHPNPNVVVQMLLRTHRDSSPPTMFAERSLEEIQDLEMHEFSRVRDVTDARDCFQRTPLYIAAACGNENCCFPLLRAAADPNSRDRYKHTILEVAVRGGHIRVVQQLLARDSPTEVNPQMADCVSSPLQAAIESSNVDMELVRLLLEKGADPDVKRLCDGKTAIQLAEQKGLSDLAREMRHRNSNQSGYVSIQHDLGPWQTSF